jgi:hypothetical protein
MAQVKGDDAKGPEATSVEARPDTTTMTDRQLAQAVIKRTIRPRVAEVMRLAEAVVAKSKKKSSNKSKPKRSGKLAKIPGQGKKKKKKR